MKKIIIPIIIIVLIVIIILFIKKSIKDDIIVDDKYDFKIHYFETDRAEDAGLISYKDNYILIDTGEESLASDIIEYLEKNNITKIDYLIITHFDEDHVGSASKIIDNVEIGAVFQSNVPKDSKVYKAYVKSLSEKGITPQTISGNHTFTIDELIININGPTKMYDTKDSNNSSLVTSINYKNTNYIFMGDVQDDRIEDFIELNDIEYDFVKMPYHGRYQENLSKLLDDINPKYAIITHTKLNDNVKSLLKEKSIRYYITKNGSIDIYSDGNNIIIKQ